MRIFKLFFSLLIVCNLSFAEERAYVINDFSQGQNSHISLYNTPDRAAYEATNVRVNETFSALSNREDMILYATVGTAAIKSLYRYYKTDNTKYIVATTGTKIYYDTTTGAFTEMRSGMTDGKRYQWFTYQNKIVGFNDSDLPVTWDGATNATANTDGHRTAGDLMAELGAPFAELNTGTALDASSWYQYRIAYYDGSTYYYSTARSNPILTGAAVYNVTLTGIPLGPTGTTHRYIYRTVGDASKAAVLADTSFYKVATIANNTATTYDDAVSDATLLGDAVPTWATVSAGDNVTPPIGEVGCIHRERLFKNKTSSGSYLYWSEPYKVHLFDTGNYEPIREDDGDKITALKEQLGMLVIGKTNTISKMFTSDSDDDEWYYNTFSFIGVSAPYSAQNAKTGMQYINRGGLFNFNGQFSTLVSDAVTDVIKDISDTDIENCVAVYFNNEYHLAYTSTKTGASVNDRVLVYDLTRDAFVIDNKKVDSFCVYDSGDDYSAIVSGSSDTDSYVWLFNETPATVLIRTKTQLDAGTFDDTRTYGDDNSPTLELAWDCTIDGWLAELQGKNAAINTLDDIETYITGATIDRPDTSGTWTSPVYKVDAGAYDKLYWNELLSGVGDVTFQIRSGASAAACAAAAWSSAFTNANGSDISGETANSYVQLRANLSTTDIDYTPTLYYHNGYVAKFVYTKSGLTDESGIISKWDTGWKPLQRSEDGQLYLKKINRIKVYYTGTSGTLNIAYVNDAGDVSQDYDIDLSIIPPFDTDNDGYDEYKAQGTNRIYTYYPPSNMSSTEPSSIGQKFRFTLSSDDADPWTVYAIEVRYEIIPFND